MKRLIILSASVLLIAVLSVLVMRGGPGAVPAQAQDPPSMPTPAEQLVQAEQLRFQLKWDEAIGLLGQVVGRQAEDRASAAMAQVRIGKYLLDQGKVDEARPEVDQVLGVFGDVRDAAFWARVYQVDVRLAKNELDEAAVLAAQIADDASLSPQQRTWGQVKRAEVDLAQGFQDIAARKLSDLVRAAGNQTSEPHNWARVRLAQIAAQNWTPAQAIQTANAVVNDHGAGKATDQQVIWALYWRAKALMRTSAYVEAAEALRMAQSVAAGRYPDLEFRVGMELGETCRLNGKHSDALSHYQSAHSQATAAGLGEQDTDWAILQIGSELRHLGMRDRGIAWLRTAIRDPSALEGMDQTVSDRMVSFMSAAEARAWHDYLLDPAAKTDPTAVFVQTEFRTSPPQPSLVVPDKPYERRYWLGRLLEEQRRWQEATESLQAALSVASTSYQRGEALSHLAFCHAETTGRGAALSAALQAKEQWLADINNAGPDGDAHYALHMVGFTFEANGFTAQMFKALEAAKATIDADTFPSRAMYVRYCLVREYYEYERLGEAKAVAEESLARFLDHPFPDHHADFCTLIGDLLIQIHTRAGDLTAASGVESQLRQRWPERFIGG